MIIFLNVGAELRLRLRQPNSPEERREASRLRKPGQICSGSVPEANFYIEFVPFLGVNFEP
jgi:hypothetical protein